MRSLDMYLKSENYSEMNWLKEKVFCLNGVLRRTAVQRKCLLEMNI